MGWDPTQARSVELKKLRIERFKKTNNLELDLSDVNLLVGTNGSGKSSVLQAVHLACCVMRQAERIEASKTATVGVEELDYLPTNDYKTLGHGVNWGNKEGTPSSKVSMSFQKYDGTMVDAHCLLRSARNAGISISGHVPTDLGPLLRTKRRFFSAYIPGISGVPNREERRSKKVIMKACSFGDSNVILRNALLLLKQDDPNNIQTIEGWIASIFGPISINVTHDEDKDLHISCEVTVHGVTRGLELAGTGFLQLIQIFCYVLLFNPGVLLIDEPDIHLHPDIQEKLVAALGKIAAERGTKIVLSTHSPFVVRGAPATTSVFWLHDGQIASRDRSVVERALGWGAFGKRVLMLSEDSNTSMLRNLLSQWPEIDRATAVLPGLGYKSLATPKQAKELADAMGGKFKVVVHRDRDSMTDDEANELVAKYDAEGIALWLPAESDVEAYYCNPQFLEVFLGCTQAAASAYVADVLTKHTVAISEQFGSQRAAHNQEFHAGGGSPVNATVWAGFQARPLKGAKGKFVFKQLKNAIAGNAFDELKVLGAPTGGVLGLDLKHLIEGIL